jgi:tRNA modification GTPase
MLPLDDTIAAIASPPGGAARGIIRISGPRAVECVAGLFAAGGADIPVCQEECDEHGRQECPPHPTVPRVVTGSLRLPRLHSPMPCDLYLWCGRPACRNATAGGTPAPQVRSYTGQPVVEIHTIGSPPLLQMVLRSLCAAGARLAGPGEFTLRAFLAGRIDLTQAEAVLGVIDADNGPALDAALGQLAGGLARPLHRLRDDLLDLLAHVEAGFDFADADLPFVTREELHRRLADAESQVAAVERQMISRAEPVDAVQAVLIGRPNTGKSSLFNALAGSAPALVSHHPGTTRDYLTAELDLDGVRCRLIDTAGMREPLAASRAEIAVEQAAQLASERERRAAQVEVLCLDSTRPLDDWERRELADDTADERQIVVLTKCDASRAIDVGVAAMETSSRTGQGVEALRSRLREKAIAAGDVQGNVVASTAARCRESLRLAAQSLREARNVADAGQEELAAAEVHVALGELGKVVGAVYSDDVLDRIFSRFCIGK